MALSHHIYVNNIEKVKIKILWLRNPHVSYWPILMVYNKATDLVICIGVAIGPVGLTSNLGRLLGVWWKTPV